MTPVHMHPINRNRVATNLNEAFSKTAFRRLLKRGIDKLLSAFHAGDDIKVWATRERPSFLACKRKEAI
jgi:hypothetical protein